MLRTWVEKAGRMIRWLLLHPRLLGAIAVLVAVVVLLLATCPASKPGDSSIPAPAHAGALAVTPTPNPGDFAADVLAHNDRLRQQVKALEEEVGRLTTIYVVQAQTKGVPAKPVKRPPAGAPQPPAGNGGEQLLPAGTDRPVSLYAGEIVKFRLEGVGVRAEKTGQDYIPAMVGAYTVDGQELGLDVLDVPVSKALELPPPAAVVRSWRVLGGLGASGQGWLGAAGLETKGWALPVVPLRTGAWVVVAAGPHEGLALGGLWFEHR